MGRCALEKSPGQLKDEAKTSRILKAEKKLSEMSPDHSGRPLTARGEKRQKKLLDTAICVFLDHGYEAASLEKIISLAGGSRSTIYKLYGSKVGLFLACLKSLVDEVFMAYASSYDESRPWEEELRIFGKVYLTNVLSDKAIGTSRLIFSQTPKHPQIGTWYYTEGAQLSYACFAKVLENKINLPFEELKHISLHFIESLKGRLYMQRMCDPAVTFSEKEIEEEVRFCSEVMEHYLRKRIAETAAGPIA